MTATPGWFARRNIERVLARTPDDHTDKDGVFRRLNVPERGNSPHEIEIPISTKYIYFCILLLCDLSSETHLITAFRSSWENDAISRASSQSIVTNTKMWYLTNFSVPKTIANKDRRVLGNRGPSHVREADCKQDIFVPRHVNTRRRFVAPRRRHPRFYDGIVNSPHGSYAEDVPSSRAEDWNGQRTLADGAVYSTTRPEGARSCRTSQIIIIHSVSEENQSRTHYALASVCEAQL